MPTPVYAENDFLLSAIEDGTMDVLKHDNRTNSSVYKITYQNIAFIIKKASPDTLAAQAANQTAMTFIEPLTQAVYLKGFSEDTWQHFSAAVFRRYDQTPSEALYMLGLNKKNTPKQVLLLGYLEGKNLKRGYSPQHDNVLRQKAQRDVLLPTVLLGDIDGVGNNIIHEKTPDSCMRRIDVGYSFYKNPETVPAEYLGGVKEALQQNVSDLLAVFTGQTPYYRHVTQLANIYEAPLDQEMLARKNQTYQQLIREHKDTFAAAGLGDMHAPLLVRCDHLQRALEK